MPISQHEFDPGRIVLVTGSANPPLAEAIGKFLDVKVTNSVGHFADGEVAVQHGPNLRNRHVFIVNPTSPIINESGMAVPGAVDTHIMETLLMADAARRGSADEITAVIPYFGYARQDRKASPRTPISASVISDLLQTVGVDRIVTVDIHAEQTTGSVRVAWDNLPADFVFVPEVRSLGLNNLFVLAPDEGGMKRAIRSAEVLAASGVGSVFKVRRLTEKDSSDTYGINGTVKGCDVYIPDDVASTLGTFTHAALEAHNNGAGRIIGGIAHGVLNGNALNKLADSPVERLLITDSILHRDRVQTAPKVQIVTIAPMLAKAIQDIETGASLSADIIHAHNHVRR